MTTGVWVREPRLAEFNEDQARDEGGRWEDTGKEGESGGGPQGGSMQAELDSAAGATGYGDVPFEENADLAAECDLASWADMTQEYLDGAGLAGDAFNGYDISEGSAWASPVDVGVGVQEQADMWMMGGTTLSSSETSELQDLVASGYVYDGDLYRGFTMDEGTLGALSVGDTIPGSPASWSSQEGVASIFAENAVEENADRTAVVMQMEGGGNALPVGLVASPEMAVGYAWQNEYVSSAPLTVIGIENRPGGAYITVRQS